jgi:hypothetical protein
MVQVQNVPHPVASSASGLDPVYIEFWNSRGLDLEAWMLAGLEWTGMRGC